MAKEAAQERTKLDKEATVAAASRIRADIAAAKQARTNTNEGSPYQETPKKGKAKPNLEKPTC